MTNLKDIKKATSNRNVKETYKEMPLDRLIDTFNKLVSELTLLCNEFDQGNEVLQRMADNIYTILIVYESLIKKDQKYNIKFKSSRFPIPNRNQFTMGWNIGDNISYIDIPNDAIYAGLIIKSLSHNINGYVVEYKFKADRFPFTIKEMSRKDWLEETVLMNPSNNYSLCRKDVIGVASHKENGNNKLYKIFNAFSNPSLFKLNSKKNENISYKNNPVSATIRQIAWEMLKSYKQNGLYANEETADKALKENKNDFFRRMEEQISKGISVPLSGEGNEFLYGIIKYAVKYAKNYVYFYLPLIYQGVIADLHNAIEESNLDIRGIFFRTLLETALNDQTVSIKNIRVVDESQFPFVIYDDKYYAIEGSDSNGNKIWIGNQQSSDNVKYLKRFFENLIKE